MQPAVFVELFDERLADNLVHFTAVADVRAFVNVQADIVRVKRGLLLVVVLQHVVLNGAGKLARFHQLAIALVNGRAEAVGAADEANVVGANAVAQKTREAISRHEHAGNVAEMQRLVAIGHARGNHRALRPRHWRDVGLRCCHQILSPLEL